MAFPKVSLAEVLIAAAVFCGLLAALRFAGDLASQAVALLAILAFLYALTATILDRGSGRAAAAGFALGVGLYAALFVAAGARPDSDYLGFYGAGYHDELGFFQDSLPTTRLAEPLYLVLAVSEWEQTDTGETMLVTQDASGTMYAPSGRVFDVSAPEVPDTWRQVGTTLELDHFLTVAHAGWALIFGYVGSLFGRLAYARGRRVASDSVANA